MGELKADLVRGAGSFAEAEAALSGVLLVDLSRGFGYSVSSAMLADFGATVVRVEPPGERHEGRLSKWLEDWHATHERDALLEIMLLRLDQPADFPRRARALLWPLILHAGRRAYGLMVASWWLARGASMPWQPFV